MPQCADNQKFFTFSETLVRNLKFDWRALIGEFCSDEPAGGAAFDCLLNGYTEKHRFYHNLSHVGALLFSAEDFKGNFSDYDGVRLAIWFHDAVYEPRRNDNEIESAKLAVTSLSRLGLAENKVRKVERLILATEKHDAAALDFDARLFLDLDLSILGADAGVYKKYSAAIRCEYSHVPEVLYFEGRKRILENFLRREFIYFTDELRGRFEAAARVNIENEIKELS
jgi:predicted metal-dependent HD superfamily phosphohydrolase